MSKLHDLEAIIEWFFNVYLIEEFSIEGFNIKLPPTDNPNFEKCKSIFPTIESIIKKVVVIFYHVISKIHAETRICNESDNTKKFGGPESFEL